MPEQTENALASPLIASDNTVYTYILNDIANAVFVSGDRLVTTKLAKKYNTSINPVREALKQLQGEGLITISPNSGARVAIFEYTALRNIFEILQLLEPYLMEWFIDEHSDEDIAKLKSLITRMENASDMDFRTLDTQFHWYMYRKHYNDTAIELWRRHRLFLLAMHSNVPSNNSRTKQSIEEHHQIVAALEAKDKAETLQVMAKHISNSSKYWAKYLA